MEEEDWSRNERNKARNKVQHWLAYQNTVILRGSQLEDVAVQ